MTYREKTPTVLSIRTRRLKPGKTFEDFQKDHIPEGKVEKTEFGYDVEFFAIPTRVINAVSVEDPNIVYSIGLSYGDIADIFAQAAAKMKEESVPGGRGDKLDDVCDDIVDPAIAFVGSDNNYGGKDPQFVQGPLAQVTPEVTAAVKALKNPNKDRGDS